MRKFRPFILVLILPILLCVLPGIIMSVIGVNQFFYENSSKNWPRAEGKIITSEVTSYTSKRTYYDAQIIYEYKTGDKNYTGSEVSFWMVSSVDGEAIRNIVNKYPVGKSVLVYYNPDEPTIVVLEPGPAWFNMGIFFGTILFIAGLWFCLLFLQYKKLLTKYTYHRIRVIILGISLSLGVGVMSLAAVEIMNGVAFIISAIGIIFIIEIWIAKRRAEGKWVMQTQNRGSKNSASKSLTSFLAKRILVVILGLLPLLLFGLFWSVLSGMLIGGSIDLIIRGLLGTHIPPAQDSVPI